ncbi:YkoP family protein [Scopulibacillus cellulosilyticus]|uniref:YkoP-like domain-containing protein n=1 Tax=Scopulibacillus cellulosilyticus TaxID=2665665 RepID=A0ABW2PVJ9_9BACL
MTLWNFVDPIYYSFSHLNDIGKNGRTSDNIFRVKLTRYKGRDVTFSDGTKIKKNDLLIKIHLHNAQLLKEMRAFKNDIQRILHLYKLTKQSMPGVAEFIYEHPLRENIKGIVGITMLNNGSEKLGFVKVEISSKCYKAFKYMAFLPIHLLSTSKVSISKLKKHPPTYLFMTKSTLLKRYLIKSKKVYNIEKNPAFMSETNNEQVPELGEI